MSEQNSPPEITIPGERLGNTSQLQCGEGTYRRNGFIYSKLFGQKVISADETGKSTISVLSNHRQNLVPEVKSVAMCKVTNSNPRFCKVSILAVGGISLKGTFKGIIRKEDVRETLKDQVKMYESFRPGDIILARVLSLGDSKSYFLTTAENELGVIYARSENGHAMVPISWCEMQCVETKLKERRKVAKVKIREV